MPKRITIVAMLIFTTALCLADDAPAPTKPGDAVKEMKADAAKLRPLVETELARTYLAATKHLPSQQPRVIYRDREHNLAYNEAEAAKLSEDKRNALEKKTYDEFTYYYTGFGSPLIYARPIDLLGRQGVSNLQGLRVLDFGYGMVGQLRLLASCGADVTGVDVHPVFRALYSHPADQGGIADAPDIRGRITLAHGHFPGDDDVRRTIGDGYDVFLSKNVLKRSYIHPERDVDERFQIKLGVSDEAFVKAMYDVLRPGGLALIYNIAPAQNPPDKPYLAHADGRCPFEKSLIERIGFEIIAFDRSDDEAIHNVWIALGYDKGQTREQLAKDLFAHYTLLRKPKKGNTSNTSTGKPAAQE